MRVVLLVSLCLLLAIPMLSAVTDGPARTFSARDLFGLRVASDPEFRADGGAIAYVRITYDIFTDQGQPSIWLVDPDTGVQSPLVVDESANFAPRWSPAGSRVIVQTKSKVRRKNEANRALSFCGVDRVRFGGRGGWGAGDGSICRARPRSTR